jgi:DnaA family protein
MTRQIPLPIAIAPHARFETYVAGANEPVLARLAAREAGEVLWLWGESGVGKTHLLQAACAAEPQRAMYLPLGARSGLVPAVLDGLGGFAMIAIDDVDVVAAAPAWNRALFELYNHQHDTGGRLVFAASQPPGSLGFQLPDLASRLRSSIVYRIAPLDDDGLLQALRLQAEARGLELPDAVGRYLLAHVRRDMGGLSAWLERLDSAALATQRKLTIPLIRETLSQGA